MPRYILYADAGTDDTADGSARAVVVKTHGNAVADALCIVVSAEHEGKNNGAHIVDGVYGVHSRELIVDKLSCADIVCNLILAGECPLESLIKLALCGNLLHSGAYSVKRSFCCESGGNGGGAEHFAVDAVLAVREVSVVVSKLCRAHRVACLGITEYIGV